MNKKIENHEFNLRQFIYTATRWSLDVVSSTSVPHKPFSVLTHHIVNADNYFDDFKNQLRLEIDKPENGKTFETDIKDRFLIGIKDYYSWYTKNKIDIEKLWEHPNCYSVMLEVMKSTEREINKYFSPKINEENKNPNIFTNNGFDLWSYLFNEWEIKESSRTDVKFIFEEMKKEGFIHKNVNQHNFLEWINDIYELNIGKTSNHNRTTNRIKAFKNAISLYSK